MQLQFLSQTARYLFSERFPYLKNIQSINIFRIRLINPQEKVEMNNRKI